MKIFDIYEMVANLIIEQLEKTVSKTGRKNAA